MGELIVVREVLLVHGKFRLEGFPVIVQPLLNLPAPHLGVLRRKQDNACRRTGLASGKFDQTDDSTCLRELSETQQNRQTDDNQGSLQAPIVQFLCSFFFRNPACGGALRAHLSQILSVDAFRSSRGSTYLTNRAPIGGN